MAPKGPNPSHLRGQDVLSLALVATAISCLMLWHSLLGMGVFAPSDIVAYEPLISGRPHDAHVSDLRNPLLSDVVDTFIPWKWLARSEIAAGRFPLWNPYSGVGTPFHANLQSQVLSPLNLFWLLLPPVWGLGAIAALKWTLAGLGMGLLLRRLGMSLPAAIFGLVAFQLSGPIVAWLQWPIAEGAAWLPWMMWAALGWIGTRRALWLALLALFVCFEWLVGHVETSFHASAFLAVFVAASLVSSPARGREAVVAWLGTLGAGLLGVGLAAAELLPFLAVLPDSYQLWLRSRVHTAGFALPSLSALMWLSPNGFGWPDAYRGPSNWVEANPYVGVTTLPLAALSLLLYRPERGQATGIRRERVLRAFSPYSPLFWFVVLLVALSMSYGVLPLSLLRELPGFSTSFNWRLISAAGFCLIVLASMSFDRLVAMRFAPLPEGWLIMVGLLTMAALAFAFWGARVWTVGSKPAEPYMLAWEAWSGVIVALAGALILLLMLGRLAPRSFALLAICLLATEMVKAAWGFNPTLPLKTFYPISRVLQFLAERGPTERSAIIGRMVPANILVQYSVPQYSMYDATLDNRYMEYSRLLTPDTFRESFRLGDGSLTDHMILIHPSPTLLSVVGIKWVLAASKDDPNLWQPSPDGKPVFRNALTTNGFTVWENLYARPFAYFAKRFHLVRPEEGKEVKKMALERMQSLSLTTLDIVQVEDPKVAFPGDVATDLTTAITPDEQIKVLSYAPGEIHLDVTQRAPRLLVVNEGWSAGWRAFIDSVETPIYRTNYLVQGLSVPAGRHQITMVYDPPAFRWGVRISLGAGILWLALLAMPPLLTRRRRVANV